MDVRTLDLLKVYGDQCRTSISKPYDNFMGYQQFYYRCIIKPNMFQYYLVDVYYIYSMGALWKIS